MRGSLGAAGLALVLMLVGCKRSDGDVAANAMSDSNMAIENAALDAGEPAAPDTISAAAAAAVVTEYSALAAKGEFDRAAELWSDSGAAAQFAADIEEYPKVAMSVGKPGEEDAGAGSIFITVPVTMNLTLRSGSPYEMTCNAKLRRVNNVPGATAKQLRWTISSIDC